MKDRNGVGLVGEVVGEVVAWVDRMEDAEMDGVEMGEVVDEDVVEGGGGGARATSHWSDALGMLKGLGCHWQNMP